MVIIDLVTVEIILFFICLLLSGFFSSSEVALISITRAKVHALLNQGRKGAEALDILKRSTDTVLITILIGNNIVNIAAASLATAIANVWKVCRGRSALWRRQWLAQRSVSQRNQPPVMARLDELLMWDFILSTRAGSSWSVLFAFVGHSDGI